MAQSRHLGNPPLSDKCFALTSRMLCSKCDADIGTGLSEGHICLSFCDEWYLSCMRDFIDPYQDAAISNPFCTDDSIICSPVQEVINSSRQFCEKFGFKVMSDEDAEAYLANQKTPVCFSGIPS